MTPHKIIWSGAENRHLVVDSDAMTLHVLKLDASAPAPTEPLPPEQVALLRPVDWASAPRIAGPQNMQPLVERLVDACWPRITEVALIFLNAPDQWPARTSFHAQAAARGTSIAPQRPETPSSPLEALGVGGWITPRLSQEVRTKGRFQSIEDLAQRIREASRDHIRSSIVDIIVNELTGQPKAAMFFGRREGKLRFRDRAAAAPARPGEDDDEGDVRPPRRLGH